MKANELMVGDKVIWNNKVVEVDTIWRGSQTAKVTLYDREKFQDVFLNDVQPIPITTEILEKNGFTYIKEEDTYVLDHTQEKDSPNSFSYIVSFRIWENERYANCIIVGYRNEMSGTIQYVHELQNALRLCKIDKEIEL